MCWNFAQYAKLIHAFRKLSWKLLFKTFHHKYLDRFLLDPGIPGPWVQSNAIDATLWSILQLKWLYMHMVANFAFENKYQIQGVPEKSVFLQNLHLITM